MASHAAASAGSAGRVGLRTCVASSQHVRSRNLVGGCFEVSQIPLGGRDVSKRVMAGRGPSRHLSRGHFARVSVQRNGDTDLFLVIFFRIVDALRRVDGCRAVGHGGGRPSGKLSELEDLRIEL